MRHVHRRSRLVLLGSLIFVLVGSIGCNQERIQRLETRADSLRDSIDALAAQKTHLAEESSTNQKRLRSANELIGEVLNRLSKIAEREDLVRENIQDVDSAPDAVENLPTPNEVRSEMNSYLTSIASHIRRTRRVIAALEQEVSQRDSKITSLAGTIDELERLVEQREESLAELRTRVDTLAAQLARARDRNEQLVAENEELELRTETMSRAYVTVADKDSLDEAGILNDRFLLPTKLRSLNPDHFTEVEVGTSRIELPVERDEVKIFSAHRHEPDLFEIRDDHLQIQNPGEFWAISRFLIVEVDR